MGIYGSIISQQKIAIRGDLFIFSHAELWDIGFAIGKPVQEKKVRVRERLSDSWGVYQKLDPFEAQV